MKFICSEHGVHLVLPLVLAQLYVCWSMYQTLTRTCVSYNLIYVSVLVYAPNPFSYMLKL